VFLICRRVRDGIATDHPVGQLRVHPWPVWARLDRDEAEAEQAAKPVCTALAIAPAPDGLHREPDLGGSGEAVDPLQDQFQRQFELELGDDQEGRLTGPGRNDITAADLALRLLAEPLEMGLHRGMKRGLGCAAWLGVRHSGFPICGPTAQRANRPLARRVAAGWLG
jgi:hypothetical protein